MEIGEGRFLMKGVAEGWMISFPKLLTEISCMKELRYPLEFIRINLKYIDFSKYKYELAYLRK